jgi:hypothetical protein
MVKSCLKSSLNYRMIFSEPNEHAASMRDSSVRKVVVANKMETKSIDKIC